MKYNLSNLIELAEASEYFAKLRSQEAVIELKKVNPNRSLRANAYLHLLLQICANEWGYTLSEIKTIWKRDIAQSIFIYHKNDQAFVRSSADLDSKEMTDAIERLKTYSAEQGLVLPEPDDMEKLMYYGRQISKNERYL